MFLLLLACSPTFSGFTAAPLATMPTVLEVTWDRTGADEAWVEYGDGLRADDQGDLEGQHRVLIPGYAQDTAVRLVPVERWGEDVVEAREVSAETGVLPSGLPALEAIEDRPRTSDSGWVLTSALGEHPGVLVLDGDGEIVWFLPLATNLVAPDVEPLRGGKGFVVLVSAADHESDISELRIYGYDGLLIDRIRAPAGHHMFEQPAPGVFAFLSLDLRAVEGQDEIVVGDSIRIVDREGGDTVLYTVWDHFAFDPEHDGGNFYPEGIDWMHANGLFWSEARQSFLVSYRMYNSVVEVDLASGAPVDLYGELGERPFQPVGGTFLSQHSPSWTPEGNLMVFDNRMPFTDDESRVIEYAVGDALEPVWSYVPLQSTVVTTLGDARRMRNGDTLVSFGSNGGWAQVDPEGDLVWSVLGEAGVVSGSVTWLESW